MHHWMLFACLSADRKCVNIWSSADRRQNNPSEVLLCRCFYNSFLSLLYVFSFVLSSESISFDLFSLRFPPFKCVQIVFVYGLLLCWRVLCIASIRFNSSRSRIPVIAFNFVRFLYPGAHINHCKAFLTKATNTKSRTGASEQEERRRTRKNQWETHFFSPWFLFSVVCAPFRNYSLHRFFYRKFYGIVTCGKWFYTRVEWNACWHEMLLLTKSIIDATIAEIFNDFINFYTYI